jgi:hypothetical protein
MQNIQKKVMIGHKMKYYILIFSDQNNRSIMLKRVTRVTHYLINEDIV